MSKYTYDKNYFEIIDTSDKAYWLGFLYADGSIIRFYNEDKTKIRSMSLELTLCEQDYNHLIKFKDYIKSNVPIRKRTVHLNEKEHIAYRLKINYTKICKDLIDKKCTPNKTYTIEFPTEDIVPHELMRDFLRGFFDGDGCVYYNGNEKLSCNITGMYNVLESIRDYLLSNGIIRTFTKIHTKENSKACEYFLYGDSCIDFLNYLYNDSSLYLDRKYEKYQKYLQDHKDKLKTGVYWDKGNKAYVVTIRINGKSIRVGQYHNYDDAVVSRKEAEILKLQKEKALLVSNG
ncbi:MAG: LAGLIDADG family homing endonuclease [Lachnospiraceae bacterium]|nr:LAGLIDADG family homing endonuclease [Lachnospiraceae bacterium]